MFGRALEWITEDWALKLTALVLAALLWTTVQAETPSEGELWTPVRVVNNDGDWLLSGPPRPDSIFVRYRGPWRQFLRLPSSRPQIVITFENVEDSVQVVRVNQSSVRVPPGLDVEPVGFSEDVRVEFDQVLTRLVPIATPVRGALPPGYELAGPLLVDPPVVRASGAGRMLARVDSLRLPVIDLQGRTRPDTLMVSIDTTGTGLIVSPRTVRVIVPVQTRLSDTTAIPLSRQPGQAPGG